MKFSIEFDPALSPSAKRALQWIALPVAVFLGAASVAHAALMPDPATWIASGKPVSASSLSANLTQLQSEISSLQATVGDAGASRGPYVPGVVTASSNTAYTGALSYSMGSTTLTGYRAGKLICEGTVGTKTAHMCTADDMIAYVQAGNTPPATIEWIAAGIGISDPTLSGGTVTFITNYDCRGYTTSGGDPGPPSGAEEHGHVWNSQGPLQEGDIVPCNSTYPVACCD